GARLIQQTGEGLGPRPVGWRAAHVPAAPAQHVAALGAHARAVLVQQARLADARLAREQDVLRLTGARARPAGLELRALSSATYESNHVTLPGPILQRSPAAANLRAGCISTGRAP